MRRKDLVLPPGSVEVPPEVQAKGAVIAAVWEGLARGLRYRDVGAQVGLSADEVWTEVVNPNRALFSSIDVRLRPLEGPAMALLERLLLKASDPEASEADEKNGLRAAGIVMQRLANAERISGAPGGQAGVVRPSSGPAPGAPPPPDEEEEPERPALALVHTTVAETQPVRSRPSSRREVGR